MTAKVKRSDAYEPATEKAKAVVELGVERAKDVVEEHTPLGHKDSPLSSANGTPTRV
jgi:hypothetical protein